MIRVGIAYLGAAWVWLQIADLALEVTDPAGPVAVGKEAAYQLKVENRGSKAADDVEIVAYFSHGIEPLGAEGGNYQVGPGQVVFDAISSIAADNSGEASHSRSATIERCRAAMVSPWPSTTICMASAPCLRRRGP